MHWRLSVRRCEAAPGGLMGGTPAFHVLLNGTERAGRGVEGAPVVAQGYGNALALRPTPASSRSTSPGHSSPGPHQMSFKANWVSRGLTSTPPMVPNDESKFMLGDPHCV
jgi:hypothetical protein